MDWKYKALLQWGFSHLPGGERMNYFFQRRVTKNLPVDQITFTSRVVAARQHLEALRRYANQPLKTLTFYEFGAGWDLIVPLTLYALGVNRQILVDIRSLIRPDLIENTIDRLAAVSIEPPLIRRPRSLNGSRPELLDELREQYGIDYRAPRDARATGLDPGSIDCITSTNTLEHIPPGEMAAILAECHRILRPGGLMSLDVDYQDHYSYFDPRITAYNFLRYSPRVWSIFSPSLHYQNRLRHPDYLELVKAAGFTILEEKRTEGSAEDLGAIERLALHDGFRTYSPRDLAVRGSVLVLSKP